jgi:hypothetical protein
LRHGEGSLARQTGAARARRGQATRKDAAGYRRPRIPPRPSCSAARPWRVSRHGAAAGRGAAVGKAYEVIRATLAALEDGTIVEAYLLSPKKVSGRPVIASGDSRAHRRIRAIA